MGSQLKRLGIGFERIEAVPASRMLPTCSEDYWNSWERPLKLTERACLLSHRSVWMRIAANKNHDPVLVLEDDAILSNRLPEVLDAARSLNGVDHLTLEVALRRKVLARMGQELMGGVSVFRLYQDRNGAGAYLLWPSGARKLVAESSATAGLADSIINRTARLMSYQIEPACAVQVVLASRYGLAKPIVTQSSIAAESPVHVRCGTKFKIRRVRRQFEMGVRALAVLHRSVRRHIEIDPNDFANLHE